ncbi:MAG: hypothetical protein GXY17_02460 [Clostridiaceae bacterium]|jgi:hypothetical protein|nr:hypothetical protein [Clostridiaceae bacterium]
MPYRRPMTGTKKYISQFYNPIPSYSMNYSGAPLNKEKTFFGIPLPNEKEAPGINGANACKTFTSPLYAITRFIQKNIKIEEIILIGLIILLLDEAFEDDLLLIALVYILLF